MPKIIFQPLMISNPAGLLAVPYSADGKRLFKIGVNYV